MLARVARQDSHILLVSSYRTFCVTGISMCRFRLALIFFSVFVSKFIKLNVMERTQLVTKHFRAFSTAGGMQIKLLSLTILSSYILQTQVFWTNRILLPKKYALAHKRYSRFCGLANLVLTPKL